MGKAEFLKILEDQLSGQMDRGEILSNLNYYGDYIDSQIREGKTEEEVMEELGDPRLIARTLLDVEEQTEGESGQEAYGDFAGEVYEDGETVREESPEEEMIREFLQEDEPYDQDEGYVKRRKFHLDLSTWYGKAIVIAAAALVLIGIILVAGVTIPVILIIALVIFLLSRLFRR